MSNVDRLKSEPQRLVYQNILKKKLEQVEFAGSENTEVDWMRLTSAVKEAVDEGVGEKHYMRNEEWFHRDCMDPVKIQNEAR